jgi:hypothetical protein
LIDDLKIINQRSSINNWIFEAESWTTLRRW